MHASDVWIEKLEILSREDAIYSFDPLSFEDVVFDFHWFTDCHLEAIFNMNTSRLQLRSMITVDRNDVHLITGVSEPGSTRYSSALSITTV